MINYPGTNRHHFFLSLGGCPGSTRAFYHFVFFYNSVGDCMYFLLNMDIFHSYVSLPEGNSLLKLQDAWVKTLSFTGFHRMVVPVWCQFSQVFCKDPMVFGASKCGSYALTCRSEHGKIQIRKTYKTHGCSEYCSICLYW